MDSQTVDEISENALLEKAKSGDFDAFQQLVVKLQPRVYAVAMRILGQTQDAEDATQQTFLALIEHLADFRHESKLTTWVLRIATNAALKILRKKNRGLPMHSVIDTNSFDSYSELPHPDFIAPWSKTADEILQQKEIQQELEKALSELDEKYRLVFILRDIERLSVRETAQALDLTEATVKVRLLRARLLLRERLTQWFGDEAQAIRPDHRHG